MKRLGIKLGAVALVMMMAFVFAGCGETIRYRYLTPPGVTVHTTPVRDGSFTAVEWGYHRINPVIVTTTFQNNQIVRVSIGENEETVPFIESVRSTWIPRVIAHQRIGDGMGLPIDIVVGATVSNMAVRRGIATAINQAGGVSSEWHASFPERQLGQLDFGQVFDVAVVGLGGAGTTAFLAAADEGASVIGIEVANHIGGVSATVQGAFVSGSTLVHPPGVTHASRITMWGSYGNMVGGHIRYYFQDPRHMLPSTRYPRTGSEPWADRHLWGGADRDIVEWFIDASGPTHDWMHTPHGFRFAGSSAVAEIAQNILNPHIGAPTSALGPATQKSMAFHRAIANASRQHPESGYVLGLRAMELLPPTEAFPYYTILAQYAGSANVRILARSVVLSSGGFIASAAMMTEHFGRPVRFRAIHNARGDGIRMGLQAGAATYNIRMPVVGNIASTLNIQTAPITRPEAVPAAGWHAGLRWKNQVANMVLSPDTMFLAMEVGMDGMDRAGERFKPEGAGAIGAPWWASGGFFASIYCQGNLDRIRDIGMRLGPTNPMFINQNIGGAGFNPNTGANPMNAWAANMPIGDELDMLIDWAVSTGNAVRANNLAELAAELTARSVTATITVETLEAQIIAYNAIIDANGTDPFGKATMGVRPVIARPQTLAVVGGGTAADPEFPRSGPDTEDFDQPFVAFFGAAHFYATSGGLDGDIFMRVLDTDQNYIHGLFAAGHDNMGIIFHGTQGYGPSASANTWALVSGRRAGTSAARAALSRDLATGYPLP